MPTEESKSNDLDYTEKAQETIPQKNYEFAIETDKSNDKNCSCNICQIV